MMVPHFLGAKKGCVFGFGVVNIQNHISTNQFFTFQGVLLSNIGFFPTTRELRSTSCQFQSQISSTHRAARWNRRHFRRSTYQGRFGSRFYIIDVWCDHPKVWKKNNLMQVPFFSGPQRKKTWENLDKNLPKLVGKNWMKKSQMKFAVINFVAQFGKPGRPELCSLIFVCLNSQLVGTKTSQLLKLFLTFWNWGSC